MLQELEIIETNLDCYMYGKEANLNNLFKCNKFAKSSRNRNLIRNKKSNKKTKLKTLLKTDGINSYLKQRLCDNNGNLVEDESNYNCLKYTMLKQDGKNSSLLKKRKSKLHVKYDVYNKFKLNNLEKVKPLEKCKYIYSEAYLLKNSKNEKVNKPNGTFLFKIFSR
jgi:hypothetical protein